MLIPLTLVTTAFTKAQLLTTNDAKIVFAGRSNVGKSSLLNALCGRTIAKTSSTPGKTQSINYYRVDGSKLYLIDLPGYGYARANHEKRRFWGSLLEYFFANVTNLCTACVLLDARLPPQESDITMIAYAEEQGVPVTGVLTKADKCTNSLLANHLRIWKSSLAHPPLVTSVKTKRGLDDLRAHILRFAKEPEVTNEVQEEAKKDRNENSKKDLRGSKPSTNT